MKKLLYILWVITTVIYGADAEPIASRNGGSPIAVPVASPEEAKQINAESSLYFIKEKEKQEPFFRFYENSDLECVTFEGTVRAVSSIPDPAENDYDNCLYALFVELDSVLSEISRNKKVSNEAIIIVPIMKDKSIITSNIFHLGDKISCIAVEYDSMPERIQEIQLSDSIQSLEHQQYYALRTNKISVFSKNGAKNFAKTEKYILPIQSLPEDENATKLRKERIDQEIARIEAELAKHGGSFEEWKKDYAPIAEKYKELCAKNWKGWIKDSYYAAGGQVSSYETEEYIKALLPYKDFLKKNNIDLIVVRIPAKGDFASSVLASDEFQEDPSWIEHYYKCLKADIEIIDPMPAMWKHRFDRPLFYYYNSLSEMHPFEGTYYYAAQDVAAVLARYRAIPSTDDFILERVSHQGKDSKFYYPPGNPLYPPQDNIKYNHVLYHNKPLTNLQRMSGSPFLFVSNSFFGYYLAQDLGLPDYVAYWTKVVPDWLYQDGDTKLLRNAVDKPELLAYRKAIILVGMPNMWGNKPTPPLPKYLLENAQKISFEKKLEMNTDSIKIVDNEQYIVTNINNRFEFKKNEQKSVSFLLNIPYVPDKTTCMLRFKYTNVTSSNVYILNPADNSVIDFDFFFFFIHCFFEILIFFRGFNICFFLSCFFRIVFGF